MAAQTDIERRKLDPIANAPAFVSEHPVPNWQETHPGSRLPTDEPEFGRIQPSSSPRVALGLIDNHRFSRECLVQVIGDSQPTFVTVAYDGLRTFVEDGSHPFDAVIMYSHDPVAMQSGLMEDIASVAQASRGAPLVVFSDAHDTHELQTIKTALRRGAQALISTRTTSVQVAIAALQFVRVGGVFAPITLQTEQETEHAPDAAVDCRMTRLTSKQDAVLAQMACGSANKVIAHKLNMSESTVKIHVRNIMRKVGATNRTQAVYNARKFEGFAPEFAEQPVPARTL